LFILHGIYHAKSYISTRLCLIDCSIFQPGEKSIPHRFGSCDGAVADSRPGAGNGSRLFELSPWMWRYGRGQPRKVPVAETKVRRKELACASRQKVAETLKRRLEQRGADFYKRRTGEGAAEWQ
jgi:hypothetical protein